MLVALVIASCSRESAEPDPLDRPSTGTAETQPRVVPARPRATREDGPSPPESFHSIDQILASLREAASQSRSSDLESLRSELLRAATAAPSEFMKAYAAETLGRGQPSLMREFASVVRRLLADRPPGMYEASSPLVDRLRVKQGVAIDDGGIREFVSMVRAFGASEPGVGVLVARWIRNREPDFATTRSHVIAVFGRDALPEATQALVEVMLDGSESEGVRLAAAGALSGGGDAGALWKVLQAARASGSLAEKRKLLQAAGRFPDRVLAFDLLMGAVSEDPELEPVDGFAGFVEMSRPRTGERPETYLAPMIDRAVAGLERRPDVAGVALQAFCARADEPLRRAVEGSGVVERAWVLAFRAEMGVAQPDPVGVAATFAWGRLTRDVETLFRQTELSLDAKDYRGTVLISQCCTAITQLPSAERSIWIGRVQPRLRTVLAAPRENPTGLTQAAILCASMLRLTELTPELRAICDDPNLARMLRDPAQDALRDFADEAAGRKER